MPLKTLKKDTSEELTLEWKLHVKRYQLSLSRNRCIGCQICTLACPKEAIALQRKPKTGGEETLAAEIDITLDKCNFCGICDIICPFGAINITVNGERLLSVIEKGSFPRLIRDIQVDENEYPESCVESEEVCPLNLITITHQSSDENTSEKVGSLNEWEKERKVKLEIQEEYCPCCRVCEFKLPDGVITVRKIFHGKIDIHPEKCPEGCTRCLDICPITDVLYLDEGDNRIHVNEMFCVYCGACEVVCPEEGALTVRRTGIRHTPVNSGAWNKALERVASPRAITKELKSKGYQKAREAVENRLGWRIL